MSTNLEIYEKYLENHEECSVDDATKFLLNDRLYSVAQNEAYKDRENISLRIAFDRWVDIPKQDLRLFGIKPMRNKAIKPIEFIGNTSPFWSDEDPLSATPIFNYVILAPKDLKLENMKFKCVQIIEEEDI